MSDATTYIGAFIRGRKVTFSFTTKVRGVLTDPTGLRLVLIWPGSERTYTWVPGEGSQGDVNVIVKDSTGTFHLDHPMIADCAIGRWTCRMEADGLDNAPLPQMKEITFDMVEKTS